MQSASREGDDGTHTGTRTTPPTVVETDSQGANRPGEAIQVALSSASRTVLQPLSRPTSTPSGRAAMARTGLLKRVSWS